MERTTHEIKCWPLWFRLVVSGRKSFEHRRYDRSYNRGDEVRLEEWDPETETYTGAGATVEILDVYPAIEPGFIYFTFNLLSYNDNPR